MKVLMTSVDLLCWKSYDQSQINSGKKISYLWRKQMGSKLSETFEAVAHLMMSFSKNLLIGQNM